MSTENLTLLKVQEVANTSLDQGIKVALMAVKTCSKALLSSSRRHGKSPCFSGVATLQMVDPDYPSSVLPCVDEANFLECAF